MFVDVVEVEAEIEVEVVAVVGTEAVTMVHFQDSPLARHLRNEKTSNNLLITFLTLCQFAPGDGGCDGTFPGVEAGLAPSNEKSKQFSATRPRTFMHIQEVRNSSYILSIIYQSLPGVCGCATPAGPSFESTKNPHH